MLYVLSVVIFLVPTILIYEYRLRKLRKNPKSVPITELCHYLQLHKHIYKGDKNIYLYYFTDGKTHVCNAFPRDDKFLDAVRDIRKTLFGASTAIPLFLETSISDAEREVEKQLKKDEEELETRRKLLEEVRLTRELNLLE
jgi:hypothetical protein